MLKQIEEWLIEPVYWTGVEIYEKYGKNTMLIRLFQGSADSYNKKKLSQELTSILDKAKEAEAAKPVIVETTEVKDLKKRAQSLMDERSALKERARVLIAAGITEGEALKNLAFALAFDIRSELDSIYGRIQYFTVNGSLPVSDAPAILSIAEIMGRRNTLRTYVSRGGKPEKIEKWKAELFELEQKIKQFKDEPKPQ